MIVKTTNNKGWVCAYMVGLIAVILCAGLTPGLSAVLSFQILENRQIIAKVDLTTTEIVSAKAIQRNTAYGVEVTLTPRAAVEFGHLIPLPDQNDFEM